MTDDEIAAAMRIRFEEYTNMNWKDYSPIREFKCAGQKCSAKTSDWFKEGWTVLGLNDWVWPADTKTTIPREPFHETEFARRLLEAKGVITKTDLSAALICPKHTGIDELVSVLRQAHLDRHPALSEDGCDFCRREMSYRRAANGSVTASAA